ncbi:flavin reductase family protein [Rhodocaloribacter litoris]|uniref:flavin reductase family protein n=1 Tax=Rhodocaloribacter litoris TaxID=2558931 RepID=UPI001421F4C1|nr:flavin reductase family protein [Rhodocaloribacter litoris]QXD15227.1 flavin reductase family protein [Rhodocaloribacter litoris]
MPDKLDGEALRDVMRLVPSPVTVVTARSGEEVRGITIGSFTSVSLDPPLVSFNVGRDARMHDLITRADRFAIHVLQEDQAHLSEHFALPDRAAGDQFDAVPHRLDPHGLPLLEDVLAVLVCRPYAVHEAGDHVIVVGEVMEARVGASGRPVLYCRRGYYGLGEPLETELLLPRESLS